MNGRGNQIMASGILKAWGLSDAQIASARVAWQDMPGGWTTDLIYAENAPGQPRRILSVSLYLTIRQYEALNKAARANHTTEAKAINALFAPDVKALLKPTGQYDSVAAIYDASQQKTVQQQLQQTIALVPVPAMMGGVNGAASALLLTTDGQPKTVLLLTGGTWVLLLMRYMG